MAHSSLSRLGHVEGGPDAVIDALLDVLGPHGTLLMPVYPAGANWTTYVDSDPLFDPRTSPSCMGKITDAFWRRPGVLRSLHPTHSVAAYGPQASFLVTDHEKSPTPCGPTSPFRKLIDVEGRIIHLGSPFWSTSSFHVVEDVVPDFPRKVYLDEPIPMRYLDLDGVEHVVPVKVHDPVTAATRIDKTKAKENEIYHICVSSGVARSYRIGRATVHLIESRPLEQLMEHLVEEGITIYE
jgi:aminoglycoside 3-N-acetyltransferase